MNKANVLIDDDGNARLGDFGQARFMDRKRYTMSFAGPMRWLAPELIGTDMDYSEETDDDQVPQPTKQTDIYAFGMVLLEVRYRSSAAAFSHPLHNL